MWSMRGALFLVLATLVLVECYPRERDIESREDDPDDIPLPSVPAIAVPSGPGFGYLPNFYGFFPDFDLIARIKALVSRLRTQIGDSFSDFDWNKGNTTSTTKVIEGHVVTVNETSIKDDDSDLVLHVKVIDVRPTEGADEASDESSESAETTTPKTSNNAPSSTNSEEHLGNEIPKQPEEGVAESLDYSPEESREHLVETREYLPSGYSIDDVDAINEVDKSVDAFHSYEPIDNADTIDEVDNSIDIYHPHEPISLHSDILVNKLMSDHAMSGGMVQVPDGVEVLSEDDRDIYVTNDQFAPKSKYVYESLPYENSQFRVKS